MSLEYSSSLKCHFPRHYRERIYDGVERNGEFYPTVSVATSGLAVIHKNHTLRSNILSTAPDITNTPFGYSIGKTTTAARNTGFTYNSGSTEQLPSAFYSPRALSVVMRYKWNINSGASDYIMPNLGSPLNDAGWFLKKYDNGTTNYMAFNTRNSGGSGFFYSQYNVMSFTEWETWVFVCDVPSSVYKIYRNSVDVSNGNSGTVQPDITTTDGLRVLTSSEEIDISRIIVFDHALSQEEVSMVTADLM